MNPILIGIDKTGKWHTFDPSNYLIHPDDSEKIQQNLKTASTPLALIPGNTKDQLVTQTPSSFAQTIDVAFPVLHGCLGEDGTIQGLFKIADIPFVGPDVLGSAIGMDKDVSKRLLKEAGIPIAKFKVAFPHDFDSLDFENVTKELGCPLFIKPANAGSSVGVSKVKTKEEFLHALKNAFSYDNKVLLEEAIYGRELEISVLGNEKPKASLPGEVICQEGHDFYSYETKYIDPDGAMLEIPANLSEDLIRKMQVLALQTFKTLCCEGMARIDFFLTQNQEFIVNEINTIPGFTKISMYPKLWEVSDLPYSDLIDQLIMLALQRYERDKKLKTSLEL